MCLLAGQQRIRPACITSLISKTSKLLSDVPRMPLMLATALHPYILVADRISSQVLGFLQPGYYVDIQDLDNLLHWM